MGRNELDNPFAQAFGRALEEAGDTVDPRLRALVGDAEAIVLTGEEFGRTMYQARRLGRSWASYTTGRENERELNGLRDRWIMIRGALRRADNTQGRDVIQEFAQGVGLIGAMELDLRKRDYLLKWHLSHLEEREAVAKSYTGSQDFNKIRAYFFNSIVRLSGYDVEQTQDFMHAMNPANKTEEWKATHQSLDEYVLDWMRTEDAR